MASEAQIAANRLNAQKSTGPRTPEGKAMMRRNPLRHGLSAATVVLFYESEAEFEQFRQDLASDFDPVGAEECALVEQIATLRWRLRRASRAEAALVNAEAERRRELLANRASRTLYPIDAGMIFGHGDRLGPLIRYEASLERQLHRATLRLDRRQAQRFERWKQGHAERDDPPAELGSPEPPIAAEPIAQDSSNWDNRPNLSNEASGRESDPGPVGGHPPLPQPDLVPRPAPVLRQGVTDRPWEVEGHPATSARRDVGLAAPIREGAERAGCHPAPHDLAAAGA